MSRTRIVALSLFIAVLSACQSGLIGDRTSFGTPGLGPTQVETGIPSAPAEQALAASCQIDETESDALLRAVADVRAQEGKVVLESDRRLNQAARSHACDMVRMDRVTVVGSNGSSVVDRVRATGYPTCGVIQMAWVGGTAAEAIAVGMRSPAHREQLLGQLSDEMGAGATIGPDGRRWWSLVIGDDCF